MWGVGMGNVNDPVYVIVCMVWEREGSHFTGKVRKREKMERKCFWFKEKEEREERGFQPIHDVVLFFPRLWNLRT